MSTYFIEMPADAERKYHQFNYPAGEVQVRLLDNQVDLVREATTIVLTVNITDGNPMPMMMIADALANTCVALERFIIIMPYLPYARADRRFVPGDCAGLSVFCGAIPWMADEIVTFDVHSPEAGNHVDGLRSVGAESVIVGVLKELLPDKPTILLPDKGSLTRYDLTKFEGYKIDHCDKHRNAKTGKLSGFTVPVITTSSAIIIDDLCDGGGTFIGISEEIKKLQPDIRMYLYVSHGIFSKGFEELMHHFANVFTTDSFQSKFSEPDFVRKTSIRGELKHAVLSTAELFEQVKQ